MILKLAQLLQEIITYERIHVIFVKNQIHRFNFPKTNQGSNGEGDLIPDELGIENEPTKQSFDVLKENKHTLKKLLAAASALVPNYSQEKVLCHMHGPNNTDIANLAWLSHQQNMYHNFGGTLYNWLTYEWINVKPGYMGNIPKLGPGSVMRLRHIGDLEEEQIVPVEVYERAMNKKEIIYIFRC